MLVWYFLPIFVTTPPLGLPTNGLVIRLLLGKPGICATSEIFTLNLAMFNMLFCFVFSAEYLCFVFLQTSEASNFLTWGLIQTGGPMLLCMSGLDSYIAVCHPLVYLRLKDPKLRLSLCLLVGVITVAICSLLKAHVAFKWTVVLQVLSIIMVIISACNILILKSLCKSGPGSKEVHPAKKRAFKLALTAFLLVNFHYLPPLMENLLSVFCPKYFSPFSILTSVSYSILSFANFTQPLSYLLRTKQLPKWFPWLKR